MQPRQTDTNRELLYFWALGDLHFRATSSWQDFQTQRFVPMFADLQALWQVEGAPAFCVSPGDIIETCALENYQLAKAVLEMHLEKIPFYPGVGNHEYFGPDGEDPKNMMNMYSTVWDKPARYSWQVGGVTCIMLDYPDPLTLANSQLVFISQETLAYLETSLTNAGSSPALIFLHCPLRNTVLDRNPENQRDYNTLQHFFAPENSQEVRNVLARHSNACLFFSGHTHSGWEAPNLVLTEQVGGHSVTYVNLMSPWYTGYGRGPHLSEDYETFTYTADDPDVLPTFAIRVYEEHINIRVRNHATRQWLKEWNVPVR